MKDERKVKLDEYEKWIESELEKGHFVPVENFSEWKKALEKAARRTLNRLEGKKFKTEKAEFLELFLKQRKLKLQGV